MSPPNRSIVIVAFTFSFYGLPLPGYSNYGLSFRSTLQYSNHGLSIIIVLFLGHGLCIMTSTFWPCHNAGLLLLFTKESLEAALAESSNLLHFFKIISLTLSGPQPDSSGWPPEDGLYYLNPGGPLVLPGPWDHQFVLTEPRRSV
jgi:hypothetical protein